MSQVTFPLTTFVLGNTLPVASGYMQIHLSKDCAIQANQGQIAYRRRVRVPLDINGNVSQDFTFWPNIQLSPNDSVYVYSVYTADGQKVLGPVSIVIPPASGQGGLGFGEAFGSSFGS